MEESIFTEERVGRTLRRLVAIWGETMSAGNQARLHKGMRGDRSVNSSGGGIQETMRWRAHRKDERWHPVSLHR